jgi:hypothetical protein
VCTTLKISHMNIRMSLHSMLQAPGWGEAATAVKCGLVGVASCAVAILVSALPGHAQEGGTRPAIPGQSIDAQAPGGRGAIAEQADFAASNVPAPPLPAGSPRLDTLRARAASLLERHVRYAEDVAAGRIDPDAHLRQGRPQHLEQVAELGRLFAEASDEVDPDRRAALSRAFFAALQPLGTFLEYADPGEGYINLISEQQQAELERLEEAWLDAQRDHPDGGQPVSAMGPGQLFTVTNLSVPLIVKAPPSSVVYFYTHDGGLFPNRLPIIEVEAGRDGIARTEWVTHGDAIADNAVTVRSPAGPSLGEFTITIVKLMLRDLPELQGVPGAPGVGGSQEPE